MTTNSSLDHAPDVNAQFGTVASKKTVSEPECRLTSSKVGLVDPYDPYEPFESDDNPINRWKNDGVGSHGHGI